jgi:hypothetical protein
MKATMKTRIKTEAPYDVLLVLALALVLVLITASA